MTKPYSSLKPMVGTTNKSVAANEQILSLDKLEIGFSVHTTFSRTLASTFSSDHAATPTKCISARRAVAKVPEDISFQTKPEIARKQIHQAYDAGLPRGVGLMDPGYGNDARLRTGISAIQSNTLLWPAGSRAARPPPKRGRRGEDGLISVKEVAFCLPKKVAAGLRSSRFARLQVRAGHRQGYGELGRLLWSDAA
jgi:DDE superfamily endonuclease